MGNCPSDPSKMICYINSLNLDGGNCCTLRKASASTIAFFNPKWANNLFTCPELPNYVCYWDWDKSWSYCACIRDYRMERSLSGADVDSIEKFVKTAPDFGKYDDKKSS